ncbi:MAG: integrase domain-containing protein [Rhodoferax sp.]|nr:integrase domain-containing protein [Rhodoferax sp.]
MLHREYEIAISMHQAKTTQQSSDSTAPSKKRQAYAKLVSARLAARSNQLGVGTGVEVLQRAQARHKNNPKAQLALFFRDFTLRAGIGRPRPVSERTRTMYADELMRMLEELRELGAGVQSIGELGRPHALKLIQSWGKSDQAASTVQNKISILRRFLTFIGKENAIPKGVELKKWLDSKGVDTPIARQNTPTVSKAWDENHIDLHLVLSQLRQECPITAIQLEMQAAFGLRMKESMMINPHAADCGHFLRVVHGTKGGLSRDVDFDEDGEVRAWQRDVLDRAKIHALRNRKGTLSIEGKRLDQSKSIFYYQCRKAGITQAKLGVTAHGLRHQYAARRYVQITGMSPPVAQDAPLLVTEDVRTADRVARETISRELGHFRADITHAYTGSLPMMERSRKKQIQEWVQRTEGSPDFCRALREAGIASAWLGGRFATGMPVEAAEKLRLFVQNTSLTPLRDQVRAELKQRLASACGRAVDLCEHFDLGSPDDAYELLLR